MKNLVWISVGVTQSALTKFSAWIMKMDEKLAWDKVWGSVCRLEQICSLDKENRRIFGVG